MTYEPDTAHEDAVISKQIVGYIKPNLGAEYTFNLIQKDTKILICYSRYHDYVKEAGFLYCAYHCHPV